MALRRELFHGRFPLNYVPENGCCNEAEVSVAEEFVAHHAGHAAAFTGPPQIPSAAHEVARSPTYPQQPLVPHLDAVR